MVDSFYWNLSVISRWPFSIMFRHVKLPKIDYLQAIRYTFLNFALPIVFFITFKTLGAKPAIGFSMVVVVVQLIAHRALGQKVSLFFIIAAVFTIGFGSVDIFIKNPKYFRLEPFAQNFIM